MLSRGACRIHTCKPGFVGSRTNSLWVAVQRVPAKSRLIVATAALPEWGFPGPVKAMADDSLPPPATRFLQLQPWFTRLPHDARERLTASVTVLQAAKGELLLSAGDAVGGWYAVLYGLVKLQTQSAEGRRQAFLGIPAGEWFGEGSVLKEEPRRYDVIALRDTELLCMPRAQFEHLRSTSLSFCQALIEQLNMRLGQAMAIIETSRLRAPDQRVALYLGPHLWRGSRRMSLSQEELGILAGLSRQTVNSVLKDFERRQLIAVKFGRVEIVDEAGLAAAATAG
jgi:CRP/FNR family cyclic AMP-dependent transcriptional regulator